MAISASLAKKIAEAKASASGNHIKDGDYALVVRKLLCDSKFNGTMFIAEFDVVESKAKVAGVEPNLPGTDCSVAYNLDTNKSAPGNTKQLFCGLLGIDEEKVSTQEFIGKLQEFTGDDQRARGMVVGVETYQKTTKTGPNAGKVGTYPKFVRIDQTDAEVAERRKKLDADGR